MIIISDIFSTRYQASQNNPVIIRPPDKYRHRALYYGLLEVVWVVAGGAGKIPET